ncbi:MAG TPA: hypothetical protein VJV22_03215 [Acidobacteriaceae bacterium]|nr:hypothetical protein [Acidobacteriaceae bacterium]
MAAAEGTAEVAWIAIVSEMFLCSHRKTIAAFDLLRWFGFGACDARNQLFRKIVAQADYVRTEGVRRTLREIAQADFNSFVKKPVQSMRLRM